MLDVSRLYSSRFSGEERAEKAAMWRVLAEHYFQKLIPGEATVLDLGAGSCDLINALQAKRRIAVDVDPRVQASAAIGVETFVLPLDELHRELPAELVDVAFASNVFEHLDSPERLLRVLGEVRRVLVPGGRLCVLQPNIRLVGGAFWDFVDHRLPLTERGMVEALTLAGLEIESVRARFLPYTTKSRLPKWPILVRAYLAIPPAQWVLGKQMLIVARKAG